MDLRSTFREHAHGPVVIAEHCIAIGLEAEERLRIELVVQRQCLLDRPGRSLHVAHGAVDPRQDRVSQRELGVDLCGTPKRHLRPVKIAVELKSVEPPRQRFQSLFRSCRGLVEPDIDEGVRVAVDFPIQIWDQTVGELGDGRHQRAGLDAAFSHGLSAVYISDSCEQANAVFHRFISAPYQKLGVVIAPPVSGQAKAVRRPRGQSRPSAGLRSSRDCRV